MDQSSSHFHSPDQEGQKFIIQSADISGDGVTLPKTYGDNRLVVMARDPLWFFAYWEITPEKLQAISQEHGTDVWEKSEVVLRVYDVTDIHFDGTNAHSLFDVGVILDSSQWYVRVQQPGRSYLIDLGLRRTDGRFISLLRSNVITLPLGRISDQTDSQWMAVNYSQQEWDQLMQISGTEHIGKGSGEISKNMAQRWEFLRAVFSASSSRLSSSRTWQSPALTASEAEPHE